MEKQTRIEDDFAVLITSFERSLLALNRSPRTIETYLDGVRLFYGYMKGQGMPLDIPYIRREHIESFIAQQLETHKPNSVLTRYRALRVFFNWLVEEGEIKETPMKNMKPLNVPLDLPAILTDDQLRAILKTCDGNDFISRRDAALLKLPIDTGMRRTELTSILLDNIRWDINVIQIIIKGGGQLAKPFGRKSAVALDRYIRLRNRHPYANEKALWIGRVGPLTDDMVYRIVRDRCKQAGLEGVHPHLFRHTFSHNWLANDGGEENLMRIQGWRSREMLGRYGRSAGEQRAREKHRDISPGDRI